MVETLDEPVLGYMSLAQLQEYAREEGFCKTDTDAKKLASRLFLATLRLGGLTDRDTTNLSRPTSDESFGFPKLINLDRLQRMAESGDLTRPYVWASFAPALHPTGIGKKCMELATGYIGDRVRFIGGQQG